MYNLLKIKVFLILIILTTNAYKFKLCCPFAHQYNIGNETCFPSLEPQNLQIYNLTEQVKEISSKDLNIINYSWCRNEDGLREVIEINDSYYLQENEELYTTTFENNLDSNKFCLNIANSDDNGTFSHFIPILCKIEEPITTTVKTTLPTTVSVETTSFANVSCECTTEPSIYPEITCENLYYNLYEYCVKCTIEKTCEHNHKDCLTNINYEFVNTLNDLNDIHVVKVNKKGCPFWQYIYHPNNNTTHISILNEICENMENTNTNTKESFNKGMVFYIGIVFLIIVTLGLTALIVYLVVQRRNMQKEYAKFFTQMKTQETEMHPMFRPNTAIYSLPDNINFN